MVSKIGEMDIPAQRDNKPPTCKQDLMLKRENVIKESTFFRSKRFIF